MVIKNHRPPSLNSFCSIWGFESKSVFMVGDNYEEEVLSANKSGIRAVWFNHQSGEERSGDLHQTIYDLRNLHKTLNDWVLETSG